MPTEASDRLKLKKDSYELPHVVGGCWEPPHVLWKRSPYLNHTLNHPQLLGVKVDRALVGGGICRIAVWKKNLGNAFCALYPTSLS